MFPSNIEIQEGAIFISDAHYSPLRPYLLDFMNDIYTQKIKTTQLILFGDIFDALFGGVSLSMKKNQELITLLNHISKDIELIYLEGNHDFNLKKLFPLAKIFSISQQPVVCTINHKQTYLAHGDFSGDFGYKIYTSIIRSSVVLSLLNIVNNIFKNIILDKLDKYLAKKNDCKKLNNFEEYISNRLALDYKCDYFIEGHFHQNTRFNFDDYIYINLGAFACNQRYFIVKFSKDKEVVEEKIYSKEI